jgi:multicomponent Na+:H+ antiporter subunit A
VNTILVDFRGMDTLGEAIVVGAAALGLLALLARRRDGDPSAMRPNPRRDAPAENLVLRVSSRILGPGMVMLSGYLFLRGHNEPGGGFIAALVAGIAVAFTQLAHGPETWVLRVLRPETLVGSGLVLSLGVGLGAALLGEQFLTPIRGTVAVPLVGPVDVTSALLFDLGIYLLVLGLLVAAIDRLGAGPFERPRRSRRAARAGATEARR